MAFGWGDKGFYLETKSRVELKFSTAFKAALYEAKGKYSLFYTCNTWANDGLKSAGLKACYWTVFKGGIFDQYQVE